jgi:sugar O-acyltransferase (sialic acid O-acetyltransferase NeuD family)
MKRLFIIGAGGHGKVIAETAAAAGYQVAGFMDDHIKKEEVVLQGYKVVGTIADALNGMGTNDYFIVGIGNNEARRKIYERLSGSVMPATIIHPSAIVSVFAKIGNGCVVLANSVVNAGSEIGINSIINSLSLIDHDTNVGSHSHIAQGTIVGSNCALPEMFVSELGQKIKSFTKI